MRQPDGTLTVETELTSLMYARLAHLNQHILALTLEIKKLRAENAMLQAELHPVMEPISIEEEIERR